AAPDWRWTICSPQRSSSRTGGSSLPMTIMKRSCWALRGGGGNFGVVTAMRHRLHNLSSVRSGMLIYPFSAAGAVLRHCADIAASGPEDLTVQVGCAGGADGKPVVMILPTWSGPPDEGEARVAPFLKLGTLFASAVEAMSYGASLTLFDPYL